MRKKSNVTRLPVKKRRAPREPAEVKMLVTPGESVPADALRYIPEAVAAADTEGILVVRLGTNSLIDIRCFGIGRRSLLAFIAAQLLAAAASAE